MHICPRFFAILLSLFLVTLHLAAAPIVYVAPDGNDENPGTFDAPFATPQRAARALAETEAHTAEFAAGHYFLDQPWELDASHAGTAEIPHTFRGPSSPFGIPAIISGGRPLKGWTTSTEALPTESAPDTQLWQLDLTDGNPLTETNGYFRQLFELSDRFDVSGRLPRARMPDDGWFRGQKGSHVTDEITRNVAGKEAEIWRKDRLDVYLTMGVLETNAADFASFADAPDLHSGELLMIASWDTSWHSLRDYNPETRDLRFFTPGRYPVNHWHYSINKWGAPVRVENVKAALNQPGEWCLNRDTGRLLFLQHTRSITNDTTLVAPTHPQILRLKGDRAKPKPDAPKDPRRAARDLAKTAEDVRLKHLRFENLHFAHNTYPMGVYDRHQSDWVDRVRKIDPTFPESADDFAPGFSDAQATPKAGAAITLDYASHIVFTNCVFRDTGNWAVHLRRDVHHTTFTRCKFTETGAGGWMVDPVVGLSGSLAAHEYSSHNTLADCILTHASRVHPAAVVVRIANAHENRVVHNELAHCGYSAISVGWNWSYTPNQCYGNHFIANHIHDVTEIISDGACFYSLGMLGGTLVQSNHFHSVRRADSAVGSSNTGMLMDQYSHGIHFDQNVIRNVQAYHPRDNRPNESHRHFRNLPAHHTWGTNDFRHDDEPVVLTETVANAGPRPLE